MNNIKTISISKKNKVIVKIITLATYFIISVIFFITTLISTKLILHKNYNINYTQSNIINNEQTLQKYNANEKTYINNKNIIESKNRTYDTNNTIVTNTYDSHKAIFNIKDIVSYNNLISNVFEVNGTYDTQINTHNNTINTTNYVIFYTVTGKYIDTVNMLEDIYYSQYYYLIDSINIIVNDNNQYESSINITLPTINNK